MLSSIYTTLRDRGALTLISAIGNQAMASVHSKIRRRRFLEKRIHDYRMLIDLEDRGRLRQERQNLLNQEITTFRGSAGVETAKAITALTLNDAVGP